MKALSLKYHIILVLFAMMLCSSGCQSTKSPIDLCTAWNAGNKEERGQIARMLIREQRLIGWSRDDVLDCLGEPEVSSDDFLVYAVDTGFGMGLGRSRMQLMSMLEIGFDSSGIVVALMISV